MNRPESATPRARALRWIIAGGAVLLAIVIVFAIFLVVRWPFSRQRATESLTQALNAEVQIQRFESVHFPHPGCVIYGLRATRPSGNGQSSFLATAEKATIRAGYLDFLLRPGYIDRIVLEGMNVRIPGPASTKGLANETSAGQSQTNVHAQKSGDHPMRVGEIVTDNAKLIIARADGKKPLEFDIHSLSLDSVARNEAIAFKVAMTNALPPGEIDAHGKFGPWSAQDASKTPLAGAAAFDRANLAVFPSISGSLSSKNEFDGTLGSLEVSGTVDVPEFKVHRAGNSVRVHAPFRAQVNALKGEVNLERVEATIQKTLVEVRGRIGAQPGRRGTITAIDFTVQNGRIQDLLQLFAAHQPDLDGRTNLHAQAVVAAFGKRFLKEVQLRGQFEIADGRFTNPATQDRINQLSARAQRHKPGGPIPQVTSQIHGDVAVNGGVAHLSSFSVTVPAAFADLPGTYNLINNKVDFHGTLKTDSKIAKSTRGIESVLLRPLDPLFKKGSAGAVIPVQITGTYQKPRFGMDLAPGKKKKQGEKKPLAPPAS